jgi:hypothetical protein
MKKPAEEPRRQKWTNKDHYALMAEIPGSNRSIAATAAARVGGLALAMGGGYAANRFGLRGAELLGAAAPGFLLDLRVGMLLRVERLAASRQINRPDYEMPPHKWLKRIGALGTAAVSNVVAFGTGAALSYAAQQEAVHDHWTMGAGALATVAGLVATGIGEFGTELMIDEAGETFDPPLAMHRKIFDNGGTLYPRPAGPSPES